MRKTVVYLATISSLFYLFHLEGTGAFLTSEKKHASGISTGTNQDVFVTETKQLVLKSEVYKRTTIKKKKSQDGGPGEEDRDVKVSIERGADWITLFPQRPHLDLEAAHFQVTGPAANEVKIEKVESEQENGITFKLYHDDNAIGRKNKTVKGQVHVTALGGFYHLVVPITVTTTYREKTDVEEVVVNDPTTPAPETPETGTPETGAPPPGTEALSVAPDSPEETPSPDQPADDENRTTNPESIEPSS